ncbi:MAG: hypothetical protein KA764_08250 [Anaerolineales bacterium]|nr:hypothetical protein [Anaerolineales bacterium]
MSTDPNLTSPAPPASTVPASVLAAVSGLMLGLGLILGYTGRPLVTALFAPTPSATPPAAAPAAAASPSAVPALSATQRAELMSYVAANTRLFRGNPAAPITLIEFSDFQ